MNPGKPMIIIGIVVLISGVIFFLQGRSMIGPESSFMYSNPEWINYGQWIAIIGLVIVLEGIVVYKASLQCPK